MLLVATARALDSELFDWILFPGALPNLLIFGVHRDWGFSGELLMFTVSAVVWFVVMFLAVVTVSRLFGKKEPPEPSA